MASLSPISLFAIFAIGLIFTTSPAEASPDPNVCIPSPPTGDGPPLPKLPTQYRLRVEANIVTKNYSTELQEYYDEPGNRGAADSLFGGVQSHTSYNYKTGQSISTFGDFCVVANMSTTPFNLYGFKMEDGAPHIGGVNDVFVFGAKYNESYIGTEYVRGILANHWQNCMYIESQNQTYLLDYYFSVPGHVTASRGREVPLRAILNGTGQTFITDKDGNIIPLPERHSFYHVYDFFEVTPGPVTEDRAFEPPLGYVCHGRISERPFPDLTGMDTFTVGVELAIPTPKRIYTVREYYNYKQNIVSYEYQPWGLKEPMDPIKEVHDYNLGLSFQIDAVTSACRIGPIPTFSGEAGSPDGEHVYLRSISSFLQIGILNWVYEGESVRRGVPCESWITEMKDYDVGGGAIANITFEYFFASSNWTAAASLHHAVAHIPVALDLKYTMKDPARPLITIKSSVSQHFFGLNYDSFHPRMVDVSVCYDSKDSKELAVTMQDKYLYDQYVQNNSNSFYIGVVNSLAKGANVTASRIANPMAIEGSGGVMTVYFKLLGIPPVEGDAVNMTKQITLDESYTKLESAINDGLMITIRSEGEMVDLPVQSKSLRADFYSTSSQSGFSAGAMAGIGIGMAVAGALLAGTVFFVLARMSKGPFSYKTQE